jgi:hypothetical protein
MTEGGAHVEISHATWDCAITRFGTDVAAAYGIPPHLLTPPRHG